MAFQELAPLFAQQPQSMLQAAMAAYQRANQEKALALQGQQALIQNFLNSIGLAADIESQGRKDTVMESAEGREQTMLPHRIDDIRSQIGLRGAQKEGIGLENQLRGATMEDSIARLQLENDALRANIAHRRAMSPLEQSIAGLEASGMRQSQQFAGQREPIVQEGMRLGNEGQRLQNEGQETQNYVSKGTADSAIRRFGYETDLVQMEADLGMRTFDNKVRMSDQEVHSRDLGIVAQRQGLDEQREDIETKREQRKNIRAQRDAIYAGIEAQEVSTEAAEFELARMREERPVEWRYRLDQLEEEQQQRRLQTQGLSAGLEQTRFELEQARRYSEVATPEYRAMLDLARSEWENENLATGVEQGRASAKETRARTRSIEQDIAERNKTFGMRMDKLKLEVESMRRAGATEEQIQQAQVAAAYMELDLMAAQISNLYQSAQADLMRANASEKAAQAISMKEGVKEAGDVEASLLGHSRQLVEVLANETLVDALIRADDGSYENMVQMYKDVNQQIAGVRALRTVIAQEVEKGNIQQDNQLWGIMAHGLSMSAEVSPEVLKDPSWIYEYLRQRPQAIEEGKQAVNEAFDAAFGGRPRGPMDFSSEQDYANFLYPKNG